MPATPTDARCWGLVVPVKRLAVAKSRLSVLGEQQRRRLALAFAQDVVTAALACTQVGPVLVVTADAEVSRAVSDLGAEVLDDHPEQGVNNALEQGVWRLRSTRPRSPTACLTADLPALRADDLAAVLVAAAGHRRALVADTEAHGTILLTATDDTLLDARYGAGSRAAHLASGAVELGAAAGLRRDVDTPEHLHEAMRHGLGRHTAALLQTGSGRWPLPTAASGSPPGLPGSAR